jgi:hypothetical protein
VKRLVLTVTTLGVLLTGGWWLMYSRPEEAPPVVAPADVPMPAQFRQNLPRHWRYVMLAPSR